MNKAQRSAGALLVRVRDGVPEVLLAHPGGPFYAKKDEGVWSVPKGLIEEGEDPLAAARRELGEELGVVAPEGPWIALGEITQKSGKRVIAFAARGDFDVSRMASNEVEMEWPRGSGRTIRFPEMDRAEWMPREVALRKVLEAQRPLIERALSEETLSALRNP